jgi:hypothetical protein
MRRSRLYSLPRLFGVILLSIHGSPAPANREPPGPVNRRSPLAITEIMYHPAPRSDGGNLEFIEIFNSGAVPLRLDGFRLSGELDFTLPTNTTIRAGGYLLIAPNPADVRRVYGGTQVLGEFPKRLSNRGGTVRLHNQLGAILVEVEYSDTPPWPVAADGMGHSVVLARPSLGERHPLAWAASGFIGGSPGTADPIPDGSENEVRINEILAHTNAVNVFVEVYNQGNAPADLSGCVLTDDSETNRFRFAAHSLIKPGDRRALTSAELGFSPGPNGGALYLINSNATRVLDAVRFGAQAPGVSSGRSPDGSPNFRELVTPTLGRTNASLMIRPIVINEIMYHPLSNLDDDQFIELHNRGSHAVNLNGWRFEDGIDFVFPAGAILRAGGHLAVARNAARLRTNYPGLTSDNLVGNFKGRLSGRGEHLALSMPQRIVTATSTTVTHVVVSELTYGTGGRWGQWSDGGGASLELIDPRADNQLAANWADSAAPTNSPWTTVQYTGPHEFGDGNSPPNAVEISLLGAGECLVDDVEVIPYGGTNQVRDPGFSSGLGAWTFEGNCELSAVENTGGIGNGACLHVRASGRGDYLGNRIWTQWTTSLNAAVPATLRLKVRWLRGWPEILMRLRGNSIEATGPLLVPGDLGTPGGRNSRMRANAGPAIWEVTHTPVLPAANEPVVVTARVADPDGCRNIELWHRVDPSSALRQLAMRDDGVAEDRVAGDGVFSATLPGQAAGNLVAFHVRAGDSAGATSRFPDDAPARECLVRFGDPSPAGSFGTYHVWMTSATRNTWINRSSARINNRPLDVTFVYNDYRAIYNAGGAFNGSDNTSEGYNSPEGTLCGYTIHFPDDDPFLNANEILMDWPTRDLTGQREQLANWMAGQTGLSFNYRRYVRLYVNGIGAESRRQVYGNGTHIHEDAQAPGADFLDEWYPGGGSDLYKLQAWRRDYKFPARPAPNNEPYYAALQNFINQAGQQHRARYRWTWRKRAVKGSANDYSQLLALLDKATADNSPDYFGAVNSVMDVEQWMRVFAFERVIGNLDSYGNRTGQNMYAVKAPAPGRWQLLPFDSDLVFGADPGGSERPGANLFGISPSTPPPDSGVPDPVAITRLRDGSLAARRAYWRAFEEFVVGPMQRANYLPQLEAWHSALLSNGVKQDNGAPVADPSSVAAWIDQRRAYLEVQLATVSPTFALTNPSKSSSTNLITITGTAPVRVHTVQVNGRANPVTWTSVTNWATAFVLSSGMNTLTVNGLDRFGATNASASWNVTFSPE